MSDTIRSFFKENQTVKAEEQDLKKPLYFDCGQCGECCSSWNIPIEAAKAKYLLQQRWVQERLESFGRTLEPLPEQAGLYRIPLSSANTCVFLADDKRCLVEANEGLSYKPHECRRFPFATVRLPETRASKPLAYETSAACKHISEKLLLAFEPIQPKPSDLSVQLDENDHLLLSQCPSNVYVQGWQKIAWPETEVWRQEIKAYFMDASLSPSQALWKALKRQKTLPQHTSKAFLSSWKERLLAFAFLRKPYRTYSLVQLLMDKQYEDRRIFGVPVSLKNRHRVHWDTTEDTRVKAYLYNLLCRRVPLIHGQSLLSLWAMAVCAYVLVRWHAITLASLRVSELNRIDSTSVCSDDISSAIRLTERYYTGHQPRFMRWFCQRWQGELLAHCLLL
jgi:Fe-S-cluster containining protein